MSGVDLLPAWPTSGDSEAAFNTKADALGPALSTMITQINTALGVTNISAWVSGAAYTAGTSVVWSTINLRPYRRKTTSSAGTTDPSLDTTNWAPVDIAVVDASGNVTIPGTQVAIQTGGSERLRIDTSTLHVGPNGGLGYGTGSGGTVTQATSKGAAVTLNKPTGQITMNAASLAAGGTVIFAVNNSLCTQYDIPHVAIGATGPGTSYEAWVPYTAIGVFYVALKNISAGALAEAVLINFAIIKGATA